MSHNRQMPQENVLLIEIMSHNNLFSKIYAKYLLLDLPMTQDEQSQFESSPLLRISSKHRIGLRNNRYHRSHSPGRQTTYPLLGSSHKFPEKTFTPPSKSLFKPRHTIMGRDLGDEWHEPRVARPFKASLSRAVFLRSHDVGKFSLLDSVNLRSEDKLILGELQEGNNVQISSGDHSEWRKSQVRIGSYN